MNRRVAVLLMLAPPLFASPALGDDEPPSSTSGAKDHRELVYMHGALGLALQNELRGPRPSADGFELQGDLALGLRLRPNLFVHAGASGQLVPTPDLTNHGMWGFGPGLTYYGPGGLFLATRVHAFKITGEDTTDGGLHTSWDDSRLGLGVGLSLGWEGWASPYFGQGISVNVFLGRAAAVDGRGDLDMLSLELAWTHAVSFGW